MRTCSTFRIFDPESRRCRRLRGALVFLVFLAGVLSATSPAGAIIPGQTDFSVLSGSYAGFDANGVYEFLSGSAVAVNPWWLVSVRHMGGSTGSLVTDRFGTEQQAQGVTYGPTDSGQTKPVDILMLHVERPMDVYYGLYDGQFLGPENKAILAGYGPTGTDEGDYYTLGSGRGTLRVGTQGVDGHSRVTTSSFSSYTIYMDFTSGDTPYESGYGPGDSGGGTFVKDGGAWKLAGVNAYISEYNGGYDLSYGVHVGTYDNWMNQTLFHPSSWDAGTGSFFDSGNWSGFDPSTGNDSYVDNGGTVEIASGTAGMGYLHVGYASTALNTVRQTGGTLSGRALNLGVQTGSHGRMELVSGTVDVEYQVVGMDGNGAFVQTGGQNAASRKLTIGYAGTGRYNLQAGTLTVGELRIGEAGGSGELAIGASANPVSITDRLYLGDATLSAAPNSVIAFTGTSVDIAGTDVAALGGLTDVAFRIEGGWDRAVEWEVAGRDLGLDPNGWVDNGAVGELVLGGTDAGSIALTDARDNTVGWTGAEALYVEELTLQPGARMALHGLNLYFRNDGIARLLKPGDSDIDGDVDLTDFGRLATAYGTTSGMGWADGDFDGDGDVDLTDFGLLATYYESTESLAAARQQLLAEPVPEPGFAGLLAFGVLGLLRRRR